MMSNIKLSIISIIITFVIIEISLQMLNYPPKPKIGWKYDGSSIETNQLGFRGKKIKYNDDDFVIVLLGDSQVASRSLPLEYMPENLLEFYLGRKIKNIKVFSVGTDGYGQDQELIAIQEYFKKYRSDMVILWFTYVNDLWNNLFPTHNADGVGPLKPTFVLKDDKLIQPGQKIPEKFINSLKILILIKIAFGINPDKEWEKYLKEPYIPLAHVSDKEKINRLWEDRNFNELIDIEKSHVAPLLTPRSPRFEQGIQLTNRLLTEILKKVNSFNSDFLIIYPEHPFKYFTRDNSIVISAVTFGETFEHGDQYYLFNGKFYHTSKRQYEENLSLIMNGLNFYRFLVDVKNCAVSEKDPHFNEEANKFAMKKLSDYLYNYLVTNNKKISTKDISLQDEIHIDFSSLVLDRVLPNGLSHYETWGRWSKDKELVLEFRDYFPKDLEITLEALSFTQRGAEFSIMIGDNIQKFTLLDNEFTKKIFIFNDVGGYNSLKIIIPNPISPKELGISSDERKLGIGIKSLTLRPININE